MTHTKDKVMINTNKAVLVNFPSGSNSGTSNIYVPFLVSEIHVRGVDIDWDNDSFMMFFTSQLVDNGPLGSAFGGIAYDTSSTTKKIRYIFQEPRDINGTYTFTYNIIDTVSAIAFPSPYKGSVCFMLEFIGYM